MDRARSVGEMTPPGDAGPNDQRPRDRGFGGPAVHGYFWQTTTPTS